MLVNNALNKKAENFTGLDDVIIKMGEQFPNYSGITLFKIATQGIALNGKKM